ncbi:hypothetical protein [Galbibacter mesophilus]|uniref:hypothetical protein n=1 Tax=Galbibacter mesophilus TaxID=379069 RepID=UPI00191D7F05|nr:hypothetical protein [Galbibacter mesophilus]MCM5662494.1 hypothetical protein [Galbibacter mesophilus]
MPLKNQVFTVVHYLSHEIESIFNAHHHHIKMHTHNFQLPNSIHHQHQHSHVAEHTHRHDTLALLASIFSSEEDGNKKEGVLTYYQLDKHFHSSIYRISHKSSLFQKENKRIITFNYFSITIPIIVPPPQFS